MEYVQGNPEFARLHRENKSFNAVTNTCSICGAWRGAFGLEPTPELYVQHSIEILREIRRVLRKDGCVFWNVGDSYTANRSYQVTDNKWVDVGNNMPSKVPFGLKPKDLCLIPFRVALEAQKDGWWVRSDIIWAKPNPMPESVLDRPTDAYEHIFIFTKSAKYYWDAEAVKENPDVRGIRHGTAKPLGGVIGEGRNDRATFMEDKEWTVRNLRNVWTFPTSPYAGAHFATFPPKLPELCIKAATPEYGCCDKCGKPYERILERTTMKTRASPKQVGYALHGTTNICGTVEELPSAKTLGWKQLCKCLDSKPVPSTVLDPFCGSGTTLKVAAELGRKTIGYEISNEYCELIIKRNQQSCLSAE